MARWARMKTGWIHQRQQSVRCALAPPMAVLPPSEVDNTSLLGVLRDCLSVAATQHRPKDVLDKMDELWVEGREKGPAHWIRHAIIMVLNDTLHFLAQWQPIIYKMRFWLCYSRLCVSQAFGVARCIFAFNPVNELSKFSILLYFIFLLSNESTLHALMSLLVIEIRLEHKQVLSGDFLTIRNLKYASMAFKKTDGCFHVSNFGPKTSSNAVWPCMVVAAQGPLYAFNSTLAS